MFLISRALVGVILGIYFHDCFHWKFFLYYIFHSFCHFQSPVRVNWSLWEVKILTACFACVLLFSLSTAGMEKLISSIRCKFSLILDTPFLYVNTGYHFLGATLYGTENPNVCQCDKMVVKRNAIEKVYCLCMHISMKFS